MKSKLSVKNWKSYVPNSIDENEVETPTEILTFTYWAGDASNCLKYLDGNMKKRNIRYTIKSKGKTSFHQVGHISKYEIKIPEWQKENVSQIIENAKKLNKAYNKFPKFTPLQTEQLRGTALSGRPLARRYIYRELCVIF